MSKYQITVKTFPTGGFKDWNPQVGHAFVVLSAPGREDITIGYYPIVHGAYGPGTVRDDAISEKNRSGNFVPHSATWSRTFSVSERQYSNMLEYAASVANDTTDNYNAVRGAIPILIPISAVTGPMSNVCTDFVKNILTVGEISPSAYSSLTDTMLPQEVTRRYSGVDTNQVKPDSAPAGSYSAKIEKNTEKLWDGIHTYDPSYANWLPNTGGPGLSYTEEHFGRHGTVRTYTNGVRYISDTANGTISWIVPNPDTGTITTTFQNLATGETTFKTVPMENRAGSVMPKTEPVPPKPVEIVSIKSFTEPGLNGHKLITTTHTETGVVSHQLRNPDGSLSNANTAANGNLSFYSDGQVEVLNNKKYVGRFALDASTGTLADGTSGNFHYDPASGEITRSGSNIGDIDVDGFSYTDSSNNGVRWNDRSYQFNDINAANSADHAAWAAFANGELDKPGFENVVNSSTDFLANNRFTYTPGIQYVPSFPLPSQLPLSTFYESTSTATEFAESMAQEIQRRLKSVLLSATAPQPGNFDIDRETQQERAPASPSWDTDDALPLTQLISSYRSLLKSGAITNYTDAVQFLQSGINQIYIGGNNRNRLDNFDIDRETQQDQAPDSPSWDTGDALTLTQLISSYDSLRQSGAITNYTDAVQFLQSGLNQIYFGDDNRNSLIGTDGDDYDALYGGAGNGELFGQADNDSYRFSLDDGADTIIDRDNSYQDIDWPGPFDIEHQNLGFKYSGNNLKISIPQPSDQIIVKGWEIQKGHGSDNHVERIETADGYTMHEGDIEQFVQAMAAFAAPTASQTHWTGSQNSNGQILLTVTH
ncbi:calcium-binding protein [Herbaspirillum seropedicae]|uniref:calcium-binding protein n=1 Tax=Herbaspirillum seropedicae TaxID=964 RepID=UPI003FCDBB3F